VAEKVIQARLIKDIEAQIEGKMPPQVPKGRFQIVNKHLSIP